MHLILKPVTVQYAVVLCFSISHLDIGQWQGHQENRVKPHCLSRITLSQ
jgi:hypothetical protein